MFFSLYFFLLLSQLSGTDTLAIGFKKVVLTGTLSVEQLPKIAGVVAAGSVTVAEIGALDKALLQLGAMVQLDFQFNTSTLSVTYRRSPKLAAQIVVGSSFVLPLKAKLDYEITLTKPLRLIVKVRLAATTATATAGAWVTLLDTNASGASGALGVGWRTVPCNVRVGAYVHVAATASPAVVVNYYSLALVQL